MKLVLDTNIYCDYAEGVPEVVDTIAETGTEIFLPVVVIAELTFGFLKGSKREYNERKLSQIIEALNIGIIDIDRSVARKYAFIYKRLVEKGKKIPINDVWIAACCMEIGGTLFSKDSHFNEVDSIDVIGDFHDKP